MPIYNTFIPNLVIQDSQDIFDINDSQDYVKKSDTFDVWRKKTNWLIQNANNNLVLGTETSGNYISTIAGTAKRVIVTGSGTENSSVTLNLPQDIDSQASPTFSSLKIGNNYSLPSVTPSADHFLKSVSGSTTLAFTPIQTFVGTQNQISIASSGTDSSIKTFSLPQDIDSQSEVVFAKVYANNGFFGNASTASKLAIPRTFTLTGDVTSSPVSFDGSAIVSISTTIAKDKVVLGNNTTGNYVATIAGTNNQIIVTGSGSETAAVNLSLPQDIHSTASPTFGNLTVGSGSNGSISVPSGLLTIGGQEYKFPKTQGTSGHYLKLGQNGNVLWDVYQQQTQLIVFEDVIPVGTIVRWDDYDTLPSSKWLRLTNAVQSISALTISTADKTKLTNIYSSGNIPSASSSGVDGATFGTSPYTANSNRIIKIASDNVVDFKVQLGDGITGTKNGSTVEYFDGTSANATTNLVTLKVEHDTNTLDILSGSLKVKDNVFLRRNLDVTSGDQTVNGRVTFTSNTTTGASLKIFETVGKDPGVNGKGSLVIEHGDSQGISSITFPSKFNYGSDYGFITYQDDYANSQNKERSILSIGTQNDLVSTSNRDVLSLQRYGGSIGIGTDNPTAQVDILATLGEVSSYPEIKIRKNNFGFTNFHNNLGSGDFNPIVQAADKGIIFSYSGAINPSSGGYVIAPWRGEASGLRITHDGKVGIGIQLPSKKLHVDGTGKFNEGVIAGKNRKYPTYEFSAGFGSFTDDTGFVVDTTEQRQNPNTRIKQKLMTVVCANVPYSGITFKVEVYNPQANHGSKSSAYRVVKETYFINCCLSQTNILSDLDTVTIVGPSNRFSAYKISSGTYEIYINKYNGLDGNSSGDDYRIFNGRITEIVQNSETATVTFHDGENRENKNIFISTVFSDSENKRFRLASATNNTAMANAVPKTYLAEYVTVYDTDLEVNNLERIPGYLTSKGIATTGTFKNLPTVGIYAGSKDILAAGSTLPIRWVRNDKRNLSCFPYLNQGDSYYKVAELSGGNDTSAYGSIRISGTIGSWSALDKTGFDAYISARVNLKYGGTLTSLEGIPKNYADFVIYKNSSTTNPKYTVYLKLKAGTYSSFDFLIWGDQMADAYTSQFGRIKIYPCPTAASERLGIPTQQDAGELVKATLLESCETLMVHGGFNDGTNNKNSRVEIVGHTSLASDLAPTNKDSLIVPSPVSTKTTDADVGKALVSHDKWPSTWGGGIRTFDILCASIKAMGGITVPDGGIDCKTLFVHREITKRDRLPGETDAQWKAYSNSLELEGGQINFARGKDNIGYWSLDVNGFGDNPSIRFHNRGVARLTLTADGNLSVTGTITAVGDIIAFSSSDRNLKENIQNIENPIEKIQKINGVSFTWNEEKQSHHKGKDIGVIAQEIEQVLPEIVSTRDNGYKAVKYEKIVALLIEGIKDLQKQIDELKKQ